MWHFYKEFRAIHVPATSMLQISQPGDDVPPISRKRPLVEGFAEALADGVALLCLGFC